MREVFELIVVCIGIAFIIGVIALMFAWWWLHILEKQCSPTDAEEERECNKYEHWHEAGNK